jgi:hypothetical protein
MSTRPESQSRPFVTRHARTIRVASFGVLFLGAIVFVIYPSAGEFSRALGAEGWARQMQLRFAWLFFLGGMTIISVFGVAMIGLLPVFQTNVTRFKRIVLLILCLLPLGFFLPSEAMAPSESGWIAVKSAPGCSVPGWVVNGPAILTGQPFLAVVWRVMRALRLLSCDYAEWR